MRTERANYNLEVRVVQIQRGFEALVEQVTAENCTLRVESVRLQEAVRRLQGAWTENASLRQQVAALEVAVKHRCRHGVRPKPTGDRLCRCGERFVPTDVLHRNCPACQRRRPRNVRCDICRKRTTSHHPEVTTCGTCRRREHAAA